MPVNLKFITRSNRQNETPPEENLWEVLRGKQFLNLKFRRQHSIQFQHKGVSRFFVADFYCSKLKLIIELDGDSHIVKEDYDEIRTEYLNLMGFTVIRLSNTNIINNLDQSLELLKTQITKLSPSPLVERGPGGEVYTTGETPQQ